MIPKVIRKTFFKANVENPMERENVEDTLKVESVQGQFKSLVPIIFQYNNVEGLLCYFFSPALGSVVKGLKENGFSKMEFIRIPLGQSYKVYTFMQSV